MKISVPVDRSHVFNLFVSCLYCLVYGKVTIEFSATSDAPLLMDGEIPVVLTKKEAEGIKLRHAKARAEADFLQDAIEDAVELLEESNDPAVALATQDLIAAKEATCESPKVLH